MHELKIHKDRVACLIGKKGETKKVIEKVTNTKLIISREGEVEIRGEGYDEYICEKIVKAIGRGFNPKVAINLTNDGYAFEIINLRDISGKNEKKLSRIKSRLIGTRGKTWKTIERLTRCDISVYGKTVGIIGEFERLNIASKGIDKLINGSPQGNVYGFLEREMKKLKK